MSTSALANNVKTAVSNQRSTTSVDPNSLGLKALMDTPTMQRKFQTVLKDKANGFVTSVVNLVSNDSYLAQSNAMSIVASAMVAATLDLPIDKNLGFAYIVPFKDKNHGFQQYAQFQLGYKGYIQLAQRSGRYKSINALAVHEGEITNWDPFKEEYERGEKKSDEVIGYLGYFELLNGFRKTVYWTKEQMEEHRVRFNKSKNPKALSGVWKSDYDAMAIKTVIRNLLSKWGPLSIEVEQAQKFDEQEAVLKDGADGDPILDVTESATEESTTTSDTSSDDAAPKVDPKIAAEADEFFNAQSTSEAK